MTGVDCDRTSLKQLADAGLNALPGDISDLPLKSGSYDVLSYFHVLEHVYDIDRVLLEAFRVLRPGGSLLIEVPDAEAYGAAECRVGVMFWVGIKEHVNHFSLSALKLLCERNGFGVTRIARSALPMKSEHMYPSLIVLATKGDLSILGDSAVSDRITSYFLSEVRQVKSLVEQIAKRIGENSTVSIWGIGVEFFSIYTYLSVLIKKSLLQLIDSNPFKVGQKVDGLVVVRPDATTHSDWLICCSYISNREIYSAALKFGWPEERIVDIARLTSVSGYC